MAKIISLTEGQFLLMSEAHIKVLASQGYQISIVKDNAHNSIEDRKPSSFNKVETKNKPVNAPKSNNKSKKSSKKTSNKNTTKGSKDSNKSKNKLNFGKVKKDDYFKVFNLNTNKVCAVGKAVEVKDKIAYTIVDGDLKKGYDLDHCVAIDKKEFGKLSKKFSKKTTKLSPADYKVVYSKYLLDLGKITQEEFAKAKDSNDVAKELYTKYKAEVKLSNAKALEILAKNSSAKAEA